MIIEEEAIKFSLHINYKNISQKYQISKLKSKQQFQIASEQRKVLFKQIEIKPYKATVTSDLIGSMRKNTTQQDENCHNAMTFSSSLLVIK